MKAHPGAASPGYTNFTISCHLPRCSHNHTCPLQAAIFEHSAWPAGQWDRDAVGALLGFALALFAFYMLVPLVLQWGGATVLNLSLLTSDLWAAGSRCVL